MQDLYETSDYQISVTLCSLGFKLVSIDRESDPRRAVFQFENSQELPQVVESFFRDELSLNPRLVLLNSKLVKDRLHSGT